MCSQESIYFVKLQNSPFGLVNLAWVSGFGYQHHGRDALSSTLGQNSEMKDSAIIIRRFYNCSTIILASLTLVQPHARMSCSVMYRLQGLKFTLVLRSIFDPATVDDAVRACENRVKHYVPV